jgi:hypothetical protein
VSGALPPYSGNSSDKHDQRIAEADLRMTDASIRHHQPVALDRSERALVEIPCLGRILDGQVRCDRAVSVRDLTLVGMM